MTRGEPFLGEPARRRTDLRERLSRSRSADDSIELARLRPDSERELAPLDLARAHALLVERAAGVLPFEVQA